MAPLNKGITETTTGAIGGETMSVTLPDISHLSLRLRYGYISYLKGPGVAP